MPDPDAGGGVVRAAGGVVWRLAEPGSDSSIEVALIHRPRYDDWSLPKGKLSAGECDLDAALREVLEETGYRVRLGRPLGEVHYVNGAGRDKFVRYWAMQMIGGAFNPSKEVDELRWVSPEVAGKTLKRESDLEILERFTGGPPSTTPVLLVRHASAGNRSEWHGDDRLRPLDRTGQRQAGELVYLLAHFEVRALVSADVVRCVQTLEPLAKSLRVEVEQDPLLSEDGFPGREREAVEAIRRLGERGDAVAACSQRQVVPHLLASLAAEDGVELPHSRADKGSVWALSFHGRRLWSAEYFPPPALA